MPQFGQNWDLLEPAVAAVFDGHEGCVKCEVGRNGRAGEAAEQTRAHFTTRNGISDRLAVAVIEELIKETEVRLAQIENNMPDQKALRLTSGEVPK